MSPTPVEVPQPVVLLGGKYLKVIDKHLRRLRRAYAHGNRRLFYDQLVSAYLLAFFNPTVNSLRTLGDLSALPEAQAQLQIKRLCRSTVSDANALMDARLLEPLIAQLRARLPDLKRRDAQLDRLLQQVQIVDGSFFAVAANVAFAIAKQGSTPKTTKDSSPRDKDNSRKDNSRKDNSRKHAKVRLDLHLDGEHLLPRRLVICGRECSSESRSAQQQPIDPQAIYILDRGFIDFEYVSLLLSRSADLVLRLTQPINFHARQRQPLDADDRDAGVISDSLGQLVGSPHSWRHLPDGQELREVVIFDPEHPDKPIRLLTSLIDLPAHVIAQLYRWRWQIELFFRWLKVHAHFRHLISHSRNGMTLGFHVAVIAVLLIYLHTRRPMSKYAYNLLALCANGWGDINDILPILEARERECARDRQRQRARQAAKRAAKTSV